MSNFYKDIKLTNIPANKVLTVDANGIIQAGTTNINDIASDAVMQSINNSLNLTSANVTNLQNDVSNIDNSVVILTGNVSNINNSMINVNADISNLSNRVSALEDATNNISARLTNINGE